MEKNYKIVARTNGWIANRDAHFNGKTEVIVCKGLNLKDARNKLLKFFCDDYEVYFPNWGVAMNSKLGRDYANKRGDGTYSYEYDSRYYSIEEEEDMKKYYAFGEEVPQNIIDELIEEGIKEEDITTDFLETNFYYEFMDNRD